MDELKADVKEIKQQVVELVKQGAVHNHLLKEHEARSIALQQSIEIQEKDFAARLRPVEKHVDFVNTVLKFSGAVLIGVLVQYIIRKII